MSQRVIPPSREPASTGTPYLTVAEAAVLARVSSKRLRNLMADGTLREGVHYTRPRGLRPRFRREALVAWIEGRETATSSNDVERAGSRTRSKVDLSLTPRLHGREHGL